MRTADDGNVGDDAPAIALGCFVGLIGGAGLGGCILLLLDGFASDMWMFVMPHSMLAMMMMGGWTIPSMMPRAE